MSTTAKSSKKANNIDQPVIDPATQLHEIQKLLFGQQMDHLQHAITELKTDIDHKLSGLEKDLKQTLDKQHKALNAQLNDLGKHVEQLNEQHQNREALIEDDVDGVRQALSKFEALTETSHNELEQQLIAERDQLNKNLEDRAQAIDDQLVNTQNALDDSKLDRRQLADLLQSLAKTIAS